MKSPTRKSRIICQIAPRFMNYSFYFEVKDSFATKNTHNHKQDNATQYPRPELADCAQNPEDDNANKSVCPYNNGPSD